MFTNVTKYFRKTPLFPLFDSLNHIDAIPSENISLSRIDPIDFEKALAFLKSYRGSQGTFNAYRREIERLLQWCGLVQKSLKHLKREDIEEFIRFCQKPPKSWIGTKKVSRFMIKEGERV
ncbi:MAG: hypothetical protein B7X84_08595, partial [Alphaproteobacteria bacterium 17-39-52]